MLEIIIPFIDQGSMDQGGDAGWIPQINSRLLGRMSKEFQAHSQQ